MRLEKNKNYRSECNILFKIIQLCESARLATGEELYGKRLGLFDINTGKQINLPKKHGWDLVEEA